MKRSSRSKSPYLRRRRVGGSRGGAASRLASRAGAVPRATVDALEPRQMLFSLLIDPADLSFVPAAIPGYGSVSADFGYFIPYLISTNRAENNADDVRTQPFTEEARGNVANGRIFESDLFRTFHNFALATRYQVIGELDENGQPDTETNRLRIRMAPGEFFTYRVPASEEALNVYGAMREFRMQVTGGTNNFGLDFDNLLVELRFRGEVVRSFTGAALGQRNVTQPGDTVGEFMFRTDSGSRPAFDEIRFVWLGGVLGDDFDVDDLQATLPPGNFAQLVDSRVFGVRTVFSGPIGASAQFLDLYGREMLRTLELGIPEGANFAVGDLDDNGVPEYNDGIGRIVITGSDRLTSLTLVGGTIEFEDGQFIFNLIEQLIGQYDEMEGAGFGYQRNAQRAVFGLPPGPGSLVIGSPYVRDNTSQGTYNPDGPAAGTVITGGFNRISQGVQVVGGSMGGVYVHGIVHGQNTFDGAIERIYYGYLVGSIVAQGDLGEMIVGTDAGMWETDPGAQGVARQVIPTGGQMLVGRTLGDVHIAGRTMMDVSVLGDLNSGRAARNAVNYYERERVYSINTDAEEITVINAIIASNTWAINNASQFDTEFGGDGTAGAMFAQGPVFGTSMMRNDVLLGAEFVGSASTSRSIFGMLGAQDPINSVVDTADVFAFATDGITPIQIEVETLDLSGSLFQGVLARVVDQDGRTLASVQGVNQGGRIGGGGITTIQRFTFTPGYSGVFFLVISHPDDNAGVQPDAAYIARLTNLAPVTMGGHRTGAHTGSTLNTPAAWPAISVLSGSMGYFRSGTAFFSGDGNDVDPGETINSPAADTPDIRTEWNNSSISVVGNLYAIIAGGDIEGNNLNDPIRVNVGGNLGMLVTGLSPVAEGSTLYQTPGEGDAFNATFSIGGTVGIIDIRGAVGVDQDATDPNLLVGGQLLFHTGTAGVRGNIGLVRVGDHVNGDHLRLVAGNGGSIGGLFISQDRADEGGAEIGIVGGTTTEQMVRLGSGGDLRFAYFPQIDVGNRVNSVIPLIAGETVQIVDDSGGVVRIRVQNAPGGTVVGGIRALPVNGSQGVQIGEIFVNLAGGVVLEIAGSSLPGTRDIIGIGQITITGADAQSAINVIGMAQIDVWRILQLGGDAFNQVNNLTPNGDIVSVDLASLNTLVIQSGDLGRSQWVGAGPRLLGPYLGIQQGLNNTVGGALGAAGASFGRWDGGVYRPTTDPARTVAYLDDVGGPFAGYLNGLVVRTGNIASVRVGGAIGDVITQGGDINLLVADSDRSVAQGRFDGIVGVVFASGDIVALDPGQGLATGDVHAPLSITGIFAGDDILQISSLQSQGAFLSGRILAANGTTGDNADGIADISLNTGGDYRDLFLGTITIDEFWLPWQLGYPTAPTGNITRLSGQGADFFRSSVITANLQTLELTGGWWDASQASVTGNLTRFAVHGVRNSTQTGSETEYRQNLVEVGGELDTLRTLPMDGRIEDLVLDVLGRVRGSITAGSILRSRIDVDVEIARIAVNSLRASTIVTGQLTALDVAGSIRNSTFLISGPIIAIKAGDSITTSRFEVTGPNGRIDTITAANLMSGSVVSAGPIGTLEVTAGDMTSSITTTTERGNINILRAGRDLNITTDIAGRVNTLQAGRHIGELNRPRIILVRGDVQSIAVPFGQLYSTVRLGGSLTGGATIGRVVNKPGNSALGTGSIVAFGRIQRVDVLGDFGGDIISYTGGIGAVVLTDGSLLAGSTIAAYDGDIGRVEIVRGHLLGTIHADYILFLVRVTADADGIFGDLGINHTLSSGFAVDEFRNQLPPGMIADAPIQGPRITAGRNIGRIEVPGGSIFEAYIHAQRAIGTIIVAGDIRNDPYTPDFGTVIAAGTSIFRIDVTGNLFNTAIIAGVRGFGADGRPGGQGSNADVVRNGRIETIVVGGDAATVRISAGLTAGADGFYGTADDLVVPGVSYIRNVTAAGLISDVTAFADSPIIGASAGIVTGGFDHPLLVGGFDNGIGTPGTEFTGSLAFNYNGQLGTLTFTGPGQAFWDNATGRVTLRNTSLASSLIVTADAGTLTDFSIVTNDDASVGTVRVLASLLGDSQILIDGYAMSVETRDVSGDGRILVGMNARSISTGNFASGSISAFYAGTITIGGALGTVGDPTDASIRLIAGGAVNVTGRNSGFIGIERDLASLGVGGAMQSAIFRAGHNIGAFTAGSVSQSRFSVGDRIGSIAVAGNVFDTSFQAGGDLGDDGIPDEVRAPTNVFETDRISSGFIGNVTVGGTFIESDLVAGMLRKGDRFFGTSDDAWASGRSTIGNVTIAGAAGGSNVFTEQYRIASTGTLGTVLINGLPPDNDRSGNFQVLVQPTDPLPVLVEEVRAGSEASVFTTTIYFNQPMDASTISSALTIAEVRNGGQRLLPLSFGTDYIIDYIEADNAAVITYSREVTDRPLDENGQPHANLAGPGAYRVFLDAGALRARLAEARLDGDANGFPVDGDNFARGTIVGDAGDKAVSEIAFDQLGNPINFYAGVDLDMVLDDAMNPDGLPTVNQQYIIRGFIGDHQDNNLTTFQAAGDVDGYKITLQAGQILRIGPQRGSVIDPSKLRVLLVEGFSDAILLPLPIPETTDSNFGFEYLIKETGTYYVVIDAIVTGFSDFGVPVEFSAFGTPGLVANLGPGAGLVGDYSFSLEVFDDGDSGFRGSTDSGDGTNLVEAPLPQAFAGIDGVLGTGDDLALVKIGDFLFTWDIGADGQPNTLDDVVTGSNGRGIVSTRTELTRVTTTIDSAIGHAGHAGTPGDLVSADVDIYHLNNGQLINPGSRIRVTMKLSQFGTNLGSRSLADEITRFTPIDYSNDVQFGVFDTTGATGATDGLLVLSPTDFLPVGGLPGTLADSSTATYGFDANGDFFIEFTSPGRVTAVGPTAPASYALYLQGVFNTDYRIEVVTGETRAPVRRTQNIFIETRGGTVDWLEAGGLTTSLAPYSARVLGFSGRINNQPVDDYLLQQLITSLTAAFDAANVDVRISLNPGDFEFQPFSTVFLTSSIDPLNYFSDGIFGASQHSDALNADQSDEAVVFLPSLATLGLTPSLSDINNAADALTAVVGRHVGELLGLRTTVSVGGASPIDIMASNAYSHVPLNGRVFRFVNTNRALSSTTDTDTSSNFYIGQQNAFSLLDKILSQ